MKSGLQTAHNSGYTLRPTGLAFGTFGGAERRIPAKRYVQCPAKSFVVLGHPWPRGRKNTGD